MIKAAVYCRVSTEDQEKEGTSLQTQLEACLKYCQDKGYDVAHRHSETYSGLTLDRPRLNELRQLVRNGQVDIVVVYCLDRISRDPTHGVILTQELEKYSAKLEAVTEDVDSSELGKLINYIRGFASKLEAEKIRERTTRGKNYLVSMGILPTGTGKGLYGYRWDKTNKKRIPIEYEVKVVEKIFNMLAEGLSRFKVAETLNEQGVPTKSRGKWHPRTIQRLATNAAYVGTTYYHQTKGSRKTSLAIQPKEKWVILSNVTPPIVSRELFDRVQERLRRQKEARQNIETRHYLLRGHVYCGHCGSPLIGTCLNKSIMYYHCRGTYPTSTRKAICSAKYIRAEMLEALVWEKVKDILSHPEVVLEELRRQSDAIGTQRAITSLDREISSVERQVKAYPKQEKRLISLLKTGVFTQDYVLDEINQTKREREGDLKRLEELKQAKMQMVNLEDAEVKLGEFYARVSQRIERCSSEDKRLAFEALALRIEATKEKVEITGTIPVEITATRSSDPLLTTEQTSA